MIVSYRDMTSENWNRRRRSARFAGLGQMPEVIGAVTAAEQYPPTVRTSGDAIRIGVTTGVLVFVLTRVLDRLFFGGGK